MKVITDNIFFEEFFKNPMPICLFGTSGVIHYYIGYIEFLVKKNIIPKYLVDTEGLKNEEKEKVNNYLGAKFKIINSKEFLEELGKGQNFYILITSSAERFRQRDLRELNKYIEKTDCIIFSDFPFEVEMLDVPPLRTYEKENKWFYDMQYAGLPLYDADPQKYIWEVYNHNGLIIRNGAYYMADFNSRYVSIKNGIRKNPYALEDAKNNIYILGSCIAYGDRASDEYTIASYLQWKINNTNLDYNCVNMGAIIAPINNALQQIRNINIKKGDWIIIIDFPRIFIPKGVNKANKENAFVSVISEINSVCIAHETKFMFLSLPLHINLIRKIDNYERIIISHVRETIFKDREFMERLEQANYVLSESNHYPRVGAGFAFENIVGFDEKIVKNECAIEKIPYICLSDYFERPHEFMEIYSDTSHVSVMGYAYIATIIYNMVFANKSYCENFQDIFVKELENNILSSELKDFVMSLEQLSNDKPHNAGAIVMNCNPFTLGHRYLIEEALKQVSYLYILVVEEDKSIYKFKDRMEMVKLGIADLNNVSVVPSGKFVISSLTFPEYFTKENNKNTDFDASADIDIFGKYIAKALKCTKRFVGDEPLDPVTNRYNEQMKEKLSKFGVDLVIIPRKENEDGVISATKGREYLTQGQINKVKSIFPQSTIEYIHEHNL